MDFLNYRRSILMSPLVLSSKNKITGYEVMFLKDLSKSRQHEGELLSSGHNVFVFAA